MFVKQMISAAVECMCVCVFSIFSFFCSGRELDVYARAPLWDIGLQYRHGTGHGIGMYLSVHEGKGLNSACYAIQTWYRTRFRHVPQCIRR